MPGTPKIWRIDGSAVLALRYEAGLPQHKLAENAAISPSTLCQYEGGTRRWPDPEIIRRLARALSTALGRTVQPEELLLPREEEPEPAAISA